MNSSSRANFRAHHHTSTETEGDSSRRRDNINGPSRCPVDNQLVSESECGDGGACHVLSQDFFTPEPLTEQDYPQQAMFCQPNDAQGGGPSISDKEADQTVSPAMNGEQSFQQGYGQQVNGWSNTALEVERNRDQMVNANEQQLDHHQVGGAGGIAPDHSLMNGAGGCEAAPPTQETQLVSDQLVNGVGQQIPHQQDGDGALSNGPSPHTQEADLHSSQRPGSPEYQPPYQETGGEQAGGYNYPIQETGQDAGQLLDEQDDLPLRFQQLMDVADVNGVSSTGQTEQAVEHNCSDQELRLWREFDRSNSSQKATRNKMNPKETFFIEEISEVQQHRKVDDNGVATAIFSSSIYTDGYEYKLGVRMYLDSCSRYVALFVHMMQGEYDDFLLWPFTGTVTLSIMDRSDARHNDISRIVQANPNMPAFQKPTEAICRAGCGFVKFAPIEEVFTPSYVKDDKLFLKIEFSS